jgi:hypothetical protein
MSTIYNLRGCYISSSGLDDLVVGSVLPGLLDFSDIPDSTPVSYAIRDGNQSEVGHGTWHTGTNTVTRDTVLNSTNSNNKIDISPSGAQVRLTLLAEDLAFEPIDPTIVRTGQANTFTVGGQVINPTADETELTLKAHSTKTTEILLVKSSDGTILGGFDSEGRVFSYGSAGISSNFIAGGAGNPSVGVDNVLIGTNAGASLVNSLENVFIGLDAGKVTETNPTPGDYRGWNVGIGAYALAYGDGPFKRSNIAVGWGALQGAKGLNSVAIGDSALYSFTDSFGHLSNVAVGTDALWSLMTSYGNTAVGTGALSSLMGNRVYDGNVALGYTAMIRAVVASANTAVGMEAMFWGSATNAEITSFVDYSGTVAGTVKAISPSHGLSVGTTQEINIVGNVDYQGLYTVTYIDADSFYFTKTFVEDGIGWWGKYREQFANTVVGQMAGRNNTTGSYNAFFGAGAGQGGNTIYAYDKDTFIGTDSGRFVTTGSENTFLGYQSGNSISSGNTNVFLGTYAGFRQTTNSNLLIIDNTKRNTVALELSDAIIYGVMGATPNVQTLRFNAVTSVIVPTTTTNAPLTVFDINAYVSTSSTGFSNGGGVNMTFTGETLTNGTSQLMANIAAIWEDATNVSRKASLKLYAYDTSQRLGITISADGALAQIVNSGQLTLSTGTATANTAPVKFVAGTLLATPEAGTMEYAGKTFYLTPGAIRKSVVLGEEIPTSASSVANTVTETVVYSIPLGANFLTAGKRINLDLFGKFSSIAGANGVLTIKLKYAGSTIFTQTTAEASRTDQPFTLDFHNICRSIGVSGKMISFAHFNVGSGEVLQNGTETTINTTTTNSIDVTVQWASASASNSITIEGAETVCVDDN